MSEKDSHLRGDQILVTPAELLNSLERNKSIVLSVAALRLFRNYCEAEKIVTAYSVRDLHNGSIEIKSVS